MQNNTALAQQILYEAREKRMNPIEMLPTAIAAVFGLWALRLQFTTENPGEIDKVLMDYQGRAVFDAGSYTRGLYSRGVE